MRGYVRMLANLSAIIQFLPEDLRDFSARHPQVKTDLEERPSDGVIKGVLDGVADFGICSSDSDIKGLHSVLYRQDKLVVVMLPEHLLALRESLAFSETLDSDYVGLHAASSINMRTHAAALRPAKSCASASMCRVSTRCAGWSRPTWASASCRNGPMNCSAVRWG